MDKACILTLWPSCLPFANPVRCLPSRQVARALALTNQITSRLYAQVSFAQYDAYKTSLEQAANKRPVPDPDLAAGEPVRRHLRPVTHPTPWQPLCHAHAGSALRVHTGSSFGVYAWLPPNPLPQHCSAPQVTRSHPQNSSPQQHPLRRATIIGSLH